MLGLASGRKLASVSVILLASFALVMPSKAVGARRASNQAAGKNSSRVAVVRVKSQSPKRRVTSASSVPCHSKGYVHPSIAKNYNSALHEMKRAGIKPHVTSTWRSSNEQARLHSCSRSRRCRHAHPGLYYALPPGSSLHEAGFAVDISGVATGPRGAKRLTPRGRRIISIMRKKGFSWRYGLADPAHFEASVRRGGYRNVKQAIRHSQRVCQVRVASAPKPVTRTQARRTRYNVGG